MTRKSPAQKCPTHQCPKCQAKLKQVREIFDGGNTLPVFECVECVMYWKMEEDCYKMNLTFAVAPGGMIVETDPPYGPMVF